MVFKAKMLTERRTVTDSQNPLHYISNVTHRDEQKTYMELKYPRVDGSTRTELYERALIKNPGKLVERLLDDGILAITTEIVKSVLSSPPADHREVTSKAGWSNNCFVYPGKTFGNTGTDLTLHCDVASGLGRQSGTLKGWKEGLHFPVRCSDYLLLASSLAPASALLDIIGESEGFCFHLHGAGANSVGRAANSSSGKTTAARVAMSCIGSCEKTDLASFQLTDRALEEYLAAHNSMLAAFDEEGRGSVTSNGPQMNRSDFAYKIASGRGAKRSSKVSARGLPDLTWCLIGITTGESPLDTRKGRRAEGDQVRMIALPVPPGSKGGIFNRHRRLKKSIKRRGGLQAIAKDLENAIGENYGVIMPTFLDVVVPHRTEAAIKIKRVISEFVDTVVTLDADPWDRRFAARFGVVLAAAILMSHHGLAPWTEKRAKAAIARLYRRAHNTLRMPDQHLGDASKRLLQAYNERRFPRLKRGDHLPEDAIGFLKRSRKKSWICIRRYALSDLIGGTPASLLSQWQKRGVLAAGPDGKYTRQIKIAGQPRRQRYVAFDLSALKELAETS